MAHGLADLIVTPMNDSFVDFDMLGHVDPVTMELQKPSLYSLTVWEARKARALVGPAPEPWTGWCCATAWPPPKARNRKRVEDRLTALSKRVGFRMGPGLRDRVIYRELFPFGLTIADLSPAGAAGAGVAAASGRAPGTAGPDAFPWPFGLFRETLLAAQ